MTFFIGNYLVGLFIAGFLSLVSAFEFNFLNISILAIVLTLGQIVDYLKVVKEFYLSDIRKDLTDIKKGVTKNEKE